MDEVVGIVPDVREVRAGGKHARGGREARAVEARGTCDEK
ncbi:hypothetical protein SCE1572_42320 [Sorangium cellulosum So0157-2]|uniref:Uncharacterized protein n=1 Tax=Sorangium cellulosum So0157-2 TaxID=1254432 RepID=S4YCM2_SORCE|nr:hypothetical protein SCE1572_42320 [Sorangium cellulosum So0157-2]